MEMEKKNGKNKRRMEDIKEMRWYEVGIGKL
jgi:hypothetical protein